MVFEYCSGHKFKLSNDQPTPQRGGVTIAEGERSEALGRVEANHPNCVSGEGRHSRFKFSKTILRANGNEVEMRLFALLLFLVIPMTAFADQPRSKKEFFSENGKFDFRYIDGSLDEQKWQVVETQAHRVLYEVVGFFSDQTVLVSNDGEFLVVVNDFATGALAFKGFYPDPSEEAVHFYRHGKKTKSVVFGDLMADMGNGRRSVSHYSWLLESWKLAFGEGRITLKTYELTTFVFDAFSGALLERTPDPRLKPGVLYFMGNLKKVSANRYLATTFQCFFGCNPFSEVVEVNRREGDPELRTGPCWLILDEKRNVMADVSSLAGWR